MRLVNEVKYIGAIKIIIDEKKSIPQFYLKGLIYKFKNKNVLNGGRGTSQSD